MSQFAGWLAQRYRNNRPLSKYEEGADVRQFDSSTVTPIDKGIIGMDADSLEYADRHFLYRGWALMGGSVFVTLGAIFIIAMLHAAITTENKAQSLDAIYAAACVIALVLAFVGFIFWMLILRDIFRYQYYPIRFDRTTRQVHVFTGGRNKVISASWSDVRFIIGRDKPMGPDEGYTYDLRGLVMRGDQVVHTFAVGSDCGPNPAVVLAHWEMIRRSGDEAVQEAGLAGVCARTWSIFDFRNAPAPRTCCLWARESRRRAGGRDGALLERVDCGREGSQ